MPCKQVYLWIRKLTSFLETRQIMDGGAVDPNTPRPHSSLEYLVSSEYAARKKEEHRTRARGAATEQRTPFLRSLPEVDRSEVNTSGWRNTREDVVRLREVNSAQVLPKAGAGGERRISPDRIRTGVTGSKGPYAWPLHHGAAEVPQAGTVLDLSPPPPGALPPLGEPFGRASITLPVKSPNREGPPPR